MRARVPRPVQDVPQTGVSTPQSPDGLTLTLQLVEKVTEEFAQWERTSMVAAIARCLNGALGTEISDVRVQKQFLCRLNTVGAVVCMQAADAKKVLSRKRRILGSSDLLSIGRDLPREERNRLYEARQKTRAQADTATARAVETSPSPASRDTAAAIRDADSPEEGELPSSAVPPPAASLVGSASAKRVRSIGRGHRADSSAQVGPAATSGAAPDGNPASALSQPAVAPLAPPRRCAPATPSAASHLSSLQRRRHATRPAGVAVSWRHPAIPLTSAPRSRRWA